MSFARVLVDSVRLLRRCPKFFMPKILIAFLVLPMFIFLPYYYLQLDIPLFGTSLTPAQSAQAISILVSMLIVVFYAFIIDTLDFFIVNPMYPLMVNDFYKKRKISFRDSFLTVMHRFRSIFLSLLAVLGLVLAFLLPIALLVYLALFTKNPILFWITVFSAGVVIFFWFVFLYFLVYPVASLEQFKFKKVIRQTISVSYRHKRNVSKAFVIFFLMTALSLLLGFQVVYFDQPGNLIIMLVTFAAFVLVRLLVSVLATYQYVLNAVFYLGLEKGVFFGSE